MLSSSAETRQINWHPTSNPDLCPTPNALGRISEIMEYLAYVAVEQTARPWQEGVGQDREQPPDRGQVGGHHAFLPRTFWIPKVSEPPPDGAEPVFKRPQAIVIQVGTPKIDLLCPCRLTLFDQLPDQERHSCEMMESFVRATVFVHDGRAVAQRQYRRNRNAVFAG